MGMRHEEAVRRLDTAARHRAIDPKWILVSVMCLLSSLFPTASVTATRGVEDEKPDLSLRASPRVAFVPVEVLFVAVLRGGDDDYEDLYCVTIEWDWDDDTQSESTPDCEPYEPGTSTIRRRYSTRHRFDDGGRYQIRISLKKHDDTVASARTTLELRVD